MYKVGRPVAEAQKHAALNEIVVERSDTRMVKFDVFVDDLFATSIAGDGLLISSSTGSTAYNMSINGPIIGHDVDCLI